MRRLIATIAVLGLLAGAGLATWWLIGRRQPVPLEGRSLESFGQAGYSTVELAARTVSVEGGGRRQTSRWVRTVRVGNQNVRLEGALAYADEPVQRPGLTGRRALTKWEERGEMGGKPFVLRGEWVQAAASADQGLGAAANVLRTVTWGEKTIEINGETRVTLSAAGEESVYAEAMNVAGAPVVTMIRAKSRYDRDGDIWTATWTRTTAVGEGGARTEVTNSGNYSGPYVPLEVMITPYELVLLLSAAR